MDNAPPQEPAARTPPPLPARRHRAWRILLRIVLVLAVGAGLAFVWVIGTVLLTFGSLLHGLHVLCLLIACLGLFAVVAGGAVRWRWLQWPGAVAFAGALAVSAAAEIRRWWTDGRFDRVAEGPEESHPLATGTVDWSRFKPFAKGNRLPRCDAPEEFRFRDGGPKLRAAYALYPIAAAAVQALGTKEVYLDAKDAWDHLSYGGSDDLFEWLYKEVRYKWDWRCDAVFGLAPSGEQVAKAAEQGISFELTPVARDAFVFFVHADNPCTNLTSQQVRDIYSGQAKTWRDAGVAFDAPLLPFQRNKNSGSQTTLERIMGDTPIMPPMEEDRLGGMGDIFRDVADYRNRRGAIGFSFRYYATELVNAGKIRLLSLDGVAPTVENIRSGAYPFTADSYLVTAGEGTGDVQRLADFLVSPAGRALVEAVGYVAPAAE
ncbi:MAG: substrate-binding domain-containing protein [Kiritimatiellae bacterium]|nr:substrate-binding domain-containing protein [Kiritimatiellia bacterium]